MKTGIIKWYNKEKNYGFITVDGESNDLFMHKNQWLEERIPAIGDKVKFQVAESTKGLSAQDIEYSQI